MGKLHGFANVVGELVRTTATAGRLVEVELRTLPDSGSRARRSAQYSVVVRMPWLTPHDVQFVTQRGYVAAYTFKAVSLWLVKNLPGVACALSVKVPDATTMPAKWTPGRVNAQETRIAEINAGAIRAAAAEKAESVREWAESPRKHETLASARAMSEAASMLDVLRSGAAWPEPDATLQPGPTPGVAGQNLLGGQAGSGIRLLHNADGRRNKHGGNGDRRRHGAGSNAGLTQQNRACGAF